MALAVTYLSPISAAILTKDSPENGTTEYDYALVLFKSVQSATESCIFNFFAKVRIFLENSPSDSIIPSAHQKTVRDFAFIELR